MTEEEASIIDKNIAKKVSKYVRPAERKISSRQLKKIKNKKLKGTLDRIEKVSNEAAIKAARSEILLTEEPGYLEAEGIEKTFNITQKQLSENVDEDSTKKIFDLKLPTFGPYSLDYTRNGRHLVIGGRKGHVMSIDWMENKIKSEIHLKETVRDVKWLHNELFYAVAQKKYVFIYDHNGLEVHRLKKHIEVNKLDFLPYHFLLVSVGSAGWLKYQDTSTGKLVAELRTKLGGCDAIAQNPWNAIMHLGHYNGTVTLWSPNMSTPLVKMLTHKGPVKAVAVDHTGKYMATSGLDGQLKLWDIRTYKPLQQYYTRTPASSLSISQLGLLGVGWGPHVTIWKDAFLTKQQSPYMNHLQVGSQIQDIHFCPFDDVLGLGHSYGISSIIIPGSGEPNLDSLEANPYQSKKQRQEAEVHSLLDKIQPEMISLDSTFIGKVDGASKDLLDMERNEEQKAQRANEEKWVPKNKARGKNSSLKRYLRKKQKNVIDERKLKIQKRIKQEKEARRKRIMGNEDDKDRPKALERFSNKEL
ncbi:BING4CT-domain-containing protein [Rhizophagus irregularis]|uniref:U three protein 7 n=3 Tax=Rhizophagus irregularis TaxID=588596 RepID=A0A2I1E2P0_9GLOM|nr:putative U3 small nucleolar RNA-associated protein [Rhizophagus irregularis DAOM 181602=DAOM 197198]EXX59722.1 Utp7p [Rhizophagus irregularis DAOM 197198w]PKC06712.1 BING4CT-domain-containing protein [Rhizophagus irregularis]PKC76102.1 BING4CT-domain-containing protein [Rhizophagus irregularis]PKY16371.1 BING4CT-domain-containing protein [Rhizophagus irregularis]POG72335.1 putative U3 small nucleolar RNA-associated protein [Rhizophagus irregularis DAOM 181602=DAOM 197198]|eukprot:XP_025179201.1 putative U3 small nucleolar RNA-associated protein [Rhizophagus irregularis DAOM 181602=DAOM 197198]